MALSFQNYFGMGGSSLRTVNVGNVAQNFQGQIDAMADMGSLPHVDAEAVTQEAAAAAEIETGLTTFREWSRQRIRHANARLQMGQAMSNHHIQASRVSQRTAQLQHNHTRSLYPISLAMGVTDGSQRGMVRGMESSRKALFG